MTRRRDSGIKITMGPREGKQKKGGDVPMHISPWDLFDSNTDDVEGK